MKLNRKWIMVLALVMSMAMATTGTLAYLTDRDSEANVFTMGNVEIDLNEEFDQGAELIPGLDIEKKPTITNTGKNDAWVWATIAIPSKLDNDDASKNIVHFNFTEASVADGLWQWTDDNGYMVEIGKKIDDTDILYNVYTVLYETPLKPGETTKEPVMTKVYMDYHIDIDTKGDVYHVENGEVTGPFWNVETDGKPVIYVSAYAIQTEGFETVQEGYAAYNAQWTTEGGVNNGLEWGTPGTIATTPDEVPTNPDEDVNLGNNIEEDADASSGYGAAGIVVDNGITFNGNGNTYTVNGANATWDCAIAAKWGTIKNLTVSGAMRGIFMPGANGDVYIDNVVFEDVIYTFNSDAGSKEYGVYVTNSTLNGWTSFSDVHKEVVFTDCTFGEGNGYAFCRPYNAPAVFTNCVFEEGFGFDATMSAVITFNNCYYGDTLITAENAATLGNGETTFFYNGVGSVVFN